ncbi:MAG: hypothetical protein IJC66_07370, partial [Kiritimatiellae bacterium]|nr:hypothetical protein [Kiritimatiellia bacterium]
MANRFAQSSPGKFQEDCTEQSSLANFKKPSSYASCASHSSVLAYVRPRESEIRFRLAWSTYKKKSPRRNAEGLMKYILRQQKNAPFPTRQWLYVFLPIA